MSKLLEQVAICVERGKVNIKSPFPADLKRQLGRLKIQFHMKQF